MAKLAVFDLGYGCVKATDGETVIEPFASVDGDAPVNDLGDVDMLKAPGHVVTVAGNPRLYGKTAIDHSKNVRELFTRQRTEQRDLMRVLFYAALGELGTTGAIDIVTGLPLAWLDDKGALVETLKGSHTFDYDGDRRTVNVENVIVLPQALGAFFGQILDNTGRLCNRSLATGRIGVIDVGSYTTGYALIDNFDYIAKGSGSDTTALHQAWERLAGDLRSKYGLEYGLHQVDYIMLNGQKVTLQGKKEDVSFLVEMATAQLASDVIAGARGRWGNALDFDAILLVGGGARWVRDAVQQVYPHTRFIEDAHLANLAGFWAYGRRKLGAG